MTIATLIDKQDTVEIVRDQVAALLAIETAAQVALATTAGKSNPDDWKLRVYQERSNPWENLPGKDGDTSPIVNVWWDSSTFDKSASNIVERQKTVATFNVDCYGYAQSANAVAGGHTAGDQGAAEAVQRAVRLVRNILMAGEYTYLGLARGIVWQRWIDAITMMQPQQNNQNVHHVVAARLAFSVGFNEFSPQVPPETLELLTTEVRRTEDDQIVILADYEYPL